MKSYILLVPKDHECMDYLKFIKRTLHFALFSLMTGSTQHELAKYLSFILQLVLDLYSSNCVKDSFTFAQTICDLNLKATFLCSFDISSLFTNIPLDETINICVKALYNSDLPSPSFSKNTFCQLMYSPIKSVEFSFDNIMYQQIAMSSLLGPVFANIFVGFYEQLLFENTSKPFRQVC